MDHPLGAPAGNQLLRGMVERRDGEMHRKDGEGVDQQLVAVAEPERQLLGGAVGIA